MRIYPRRFKTDNPSWVGVNGIEIRKPKGPVIWICENRRPEASNWYTEEDVDSSDKFFADDFYEITSGEFLKDIFRSWKAKDGT